MALDPNGVLGGTRVTMRVGHRWSGVNCNGQTSAVVGRGPAGVQVELLEGYCVAVRATLALPSRLFRCEWRSSCLGEDRCATCTELLARHRRRARAVARPEDALLHALEGVLVAPIRIVACAGSRVLPESQCPPIVPVTIPTRSRSLAFRCLTALGIAESPGALSLGAGHSSPLDASNCAKIMGVRIPARLSARICSA